MSITSFAKELSIADEEIQSKSLLQFCLKFISTSACDVFYVLYITETFWILNDTKFRTPPQDPSRGFSAICQKWRFWI